MKGEPVETVIPLLEETLRIAKYWRETGKVRVSVTTTEETRMVEEVLQQRNVEVERVPVGRQVAEAPPVREEGNTLVIPVLEEVLVVERRLVLREEVRIRLRTEERRESAPVTLRRQEAAVERLPPDPSPPVPHTTEESDAMRTITGLFDSRPEAERAVEQMVQEYNLDRDRIQVHAAGAENATAGTFERRSEGHHGFMASLRDLFLPEQDRASFSEGMRRGGILVSAQVPEEMVEKVSDVFERNGAVDLDAREAEWRQAGWAGVDPDATPAPGETVVGPSSDGSTTGLAAMQAGGAASAGAAGAATAGMTGAAALQGTAGGSEAIPIVEERLRVGKRDVTHGRVRVRSYVVETPVEEQVRLREERVQVERRPVDRPLTGAEAAFQDRVIEATETAEEAVVDKEARVREELVIRKEATERTETISDTVRRTEVEVEDDRTRTAGTTPRDPAR